MLSRPTTRSHKVISLLIKAGILIFSFFYILYKLSTVDAAAISASLQRADLFLLLPAFLLMFLNWGLEALKWQWLIVPLERISFRTALRSVYAGVTVSIFMPNRVGEFAGRIFFLEKADKVDATLKNFVGAGLQFLVTFITGTVALYIFVRWQRTYLFSSDIVLAVEVTAACLLLLLIAFILLKNTGTRFPGRWQSHLQALTDVPLLQLTGLFGLSALRYSVFLLQYYLVLCAFGVHTGFLVSLMLIALTFLVTSVIPSFALTEVVTRGAVAYTFFSYVTPDTAAVVAASLVVWIINLALPAVIGSAFTWQLKFFRK